MRFTKQQTIFLFLLKEDYLDELKLDEVKLFAVQFASYVKGTYKDTYNKILESKVLSRDDESVFRNAVEEFKLIFSKS